MSALLDHRGEAIAADRIAQVRVSATPDRRRDGFNYAPAYDSGWYDKQATVEWAPSMASADGAVLPNRSLTLARVRDLIRNDPTAGAALQRLADMLVGQGLRLSAMPDAAALGITTDAAHELGSAMEREWRLFAEDPRFFCDAQRRMSMNGLARLFAKTSLSAGEMTAVLTWRETPGARYATCVLAVDPDRVSNPYGAIDALDMRGGVQMDAFGAPVGYHVRNAHAGDWWAYGKNWTWSYVPRETSWGRPVFIHGFEPEREGQTRAISPFASLVARFRMLDRFSETELASAIANALFAAFVETDLPPDEIAERMTATQAVNGGRLSYLDRVVDHYERNPAKLGGVRIPVMLPGSKITMNSSPRQTTSFPAFERAFINRAAARLGLTGELLTDFSQTNYSSARAALNEVWRAIRRMSNVQAEQVMSPIYFAVMEEAFDKGYIRPPAGAPDFWEMPGAYLRGRWIGPGRGYVDPTKEAEAAALRMESLISTLEAECAEQGLDYEEVLDQLERENKAIEKRGLSRQSVVQSIKADKIGRAMNEEARGDKNQ